jgi:hypothetical protein
MAVTIGVTSNYAGTLGRVFGHVQVVYSTGVTLELPDGSEIYLTEFGALVVMPGAAPNRFIPYGSITEIVEAPLPGSSEQTSPDDGQTHD